VTVASAFEGLWLVLWAVVVLWVLCLLAARTGIPVLGAPWRTQVRLRHRLWHAEAVEDCDLDGFPLGTDGRGRRCYMPDDGVHVYGVGHRHPISGAPRVCVRRMDGDAVFCDRAGRPLRRLPAGLLHADPDLYLPLGALDARAEHADRFSRRTQRQAAAR
jgi:hypothetical protein